MVLDAISNFFRKLDRRIKILYTFIGVHQGHQQLSMQYHQLYATALGTNPVELGTLNSISRVASSAMSIPSGWVADRYGAKTTLLIGLSLTAVVATIYSLVGNWLMLIPAILLYGAGSGLILPYVDILLINYGKAEDKAVTIARASN
jgi:MFS family permease